MSRAARSPESMRCLFRAMVVVAILTAQTIAVGAPLPVSAADESVFFERLSIEQGLSQSIVECIIQDSRGFMWFGTQDGLNQYDGYRFMVMREKPQDVNSLSQNYVLSLC